MKRTDQRWLSKLAWTLLKYFFLSLFGMVMACILLVTFEAFHILEILLIFLGQWLWRLGMILLCIVGTAVFFESLR